MCISHQAFAEWCDDEQGFVPGFVERLNAIMDVETVIKEANDPAFGITPSAHMKYVDMNLIFNKTFPKAGKKKQVKWSCLKGDENGFRNTGSRGKALGFASVKDGEIRVELNSGLDNIARDGTAYHESIHAIQFMLATADKRTKDFNMIDSLVGDALETSEILGTSHEERVEILSDIDNFSHDPESYLKAYTNNNLCMEYAAHFFEYKFYGHLNRDVSSFKEMHDFINKGDDSLLIDRLNEQYVSHLLGREYSKRELNQAIQICKDVGFPNSMLVFNKTIELGSNGQLIGLDD